MSTLKMSPKTVIITALALGRSAVHGLWSAFAVAVAVAVHGLGMDGIGSETPGVGGVNGERGFAGVLRACTLQPFGDSPRVGHLTAVWPA